MSGASEGPAAVLSLAERLLERPEARTAGLWPRAAALLARQALEGALDELWRARRLELGACSTKAQLICLREYLGDPELAGRVHHAWMALSQACHHHPYELAPTADELRGLIEVVGELASRVTGQGPPGPTAGR